MAGTALPALKIKPADASLVKIFRSLLENSTPPIRAAVESNKSIPLVIEAPVAEVVIKEILPAGAEMFKGTMGKEIAVTFTAPGAYGVKCAPHVGMGMVALVVVGDEPVDIEAVKAAKLPKMAKDRMATIVAQLAP